MPIAMDPRIYILMRKYVTNSLTQDERMELHQIQMKGDSAWKVLVEMEENGLIPAAFLQQEQAEIKRGIERLRLRHKMQEQGVAQSLRILPSIRLLFGCRK